MTFHKVLCLRDANPILVGLDIGGSLTKIAILLRKDLGKKTKLKMFDCDIYEKIEFKDQMLLMKYIPTIKFETEVIPVMKKLKKMFYFSHIYATGGGAFRYSDLMQKKLKINPLKQDEHKSLVLGYCLMNKYQTFYEVIAEERYKSVPIEDLRFPHIAVNIGTGVSILTVRSPHDIQRSTGTLIGGGTFLGLSKLLLNMDSFHDILALTKIGRNQDVDLLVGDIYGQAKTSLGLSTNLIASSFGKVPDQKKTLKKEDIAYSLLSMTCFQIAQLAYLVGRENQINRIYYFGNFTMRNSNAIDWLHNATKLWNPDLTIRFNYYDGYLGSIGTLVKEI